MVFTFKKTVAHRFVCQATAKERSDKPTPKICRLAEQRLGDDRVALLKLRGGAVVKVPAPSVRKGGSCRWFKNLLVGPDAELAQGATWYIDGSLIMGNWSAFRVTGFGVVVVSAEGKLIGYGFGSPPTRISTAAAAELWAIDFVISAYAFPPTMKTDCASILTSARGGTVSATCASRPLARLWKSIAENISIGVLELVRDGFIS